MSRLPARHKIGVTAIWLIVFALIALSFGGCVSQRIPKKEVNASIKMGKHLNAVENIVKMYPDLVDSVQDDIQVGITMDADSMKTLNEIDSAAIIAAFDEYDTELLKKDSLVRALKSGQLTFKDSIQTHYSLQRLNQRLGKSRFEVVKEVFKDTVLVQTRDLMIYIGEDSVMVQVNMTTIVKSGIPNTTFTLEAIDQKVTVQNKSAIFTVYNKIKFPWWITVGAILIAALIIIKKFFLPLL